MPHTNLRAWNIRIDEALFLCGMYKGAFLKAFGVDIFFDDQQKHCESARQHVATGHVPHSPVPCVDQGGQRITFSRR